MIILLTEQEMQSHEYKIFIKNFSKLKSILNIYLKNLVDCFVMERIIDLEDRDTIRVDSLLDNIGVHLKSVVNSTFLEVMKESGNLAVDMLSMDKTSTVDFTIINHVEHVCSTGFCTPYKLSEDKFLRRGYTTNKIIQKLPKSFIDEIRKTKTLDNLFDVIVESPYCNCMDEYSLAGGNGSCISST